MTAQAAPKTFPWLPLTYAAFCLLSVAPFALVKYPGVIDFPNHAARLYIECHASDPTYAAMFGIQLGNIPNLAMDLVNVVQCGVLGPIALLKTLMVVALLTIEVCAWSIQKRLFGQINAALLLVPALA